METKTTEELNDMIDDDIMIVDENELKTESKTEGEISEEIIQDLVEDEAPPRRPDPTPAELKEYFEKVDERQKFLAIQKGAQEFTFDDGFSCIARDHKNADRKHNNWKNGKR